MQLLTVGLSSIAYTHTHTHTHMCVCVYVCVHVCVSVCVCVCVCVPQLQCGPRSLLPLRGATNQTQEVWLQQVSLLAAPS